MQQDVNTAPGPTPTVSVAITAFNSEKWITRAIESVLMQQTTFPIEIVVADDCSTDGTAAIAEDLRQHHPDKLRVLARQKNVGIQRNYFETFGMCRGKYIAWLDADDYWTDPDKLAIQVQTMEDDPSVAVCCHFVRWVTPDTGVQRNFPSLSPGRYDLSELVRRNFLPSPSIMFRNGIQRKLPEWYFDLAPVTDWPIWILAAQTGDILLLDRMMADYQLTPNSSFAGQSQLKGNQADIRFYDKVESILPAQFHRSARSQRGIRYENVAYILRKQGDYRGSREAAVKAFRSPSLLDNIPSKTKSLIAAVVREAQSRLRN
ncbi:MAG TPA: glycosyltransferase [Edaphobacter sp.]|jgi:glycosyltransferase involved in cell wall biosynthesis|nr:glycosyltransferase [Edaphobacter sp.]